MNLRLPSKDKMFKRKQSKKMVIIKENIEIDLRIESREGKKIYVWKGYIILGASIERKEMK